MRFGSVDTFMELGDWSHRMGRPIANEGFLKALLTHGAYDTYEFFCPDVHHFTRFQERLEELVPAKELRSRVEVSLHVSLAEALASREYHVFHQGDFTYFMPHLIALRNRRAAVPFPVTGVTHSLNGVFMNQRYVELLLAGPAPWDGVVCTSRCALEAVRKGIQGARDRILNATGADLGCPIKLSHIPLGVEEDLFEPVDRQAARDFFRIPQEFRVCLTVGRISPRQKGDLWPVISLFRRIFSAPDAKNWIWIIAGGCDEAAAGTLEGLVAQEGLKESVLLFPNFPPEVKARLYGAADFYLSPVDNFQETFGLSVVEAMAAGLPVVCSDFSGYRELVEDGKTGFLVETLWPRELPDFIGENLGLLDESMASYYSSQCLALDLAQMERAILFLYRNKEARLRMGEEARKGAQAYHWRKVIPRYEAFWETLRREIPKTSPRREGKRQNPLLSDQAGIFSHYPSRRVGSDSLIGLTPLGGRAAQGGPRPPGYEDTRACLFEELEDYLLQALAHGPATLDRLRKGAFAALGATRGQVDFHVLWMMKQGLLGSVPQEGKKGEGS